MTHGRGVASTAFGEPARPRELVTLPGVALHLDESSYDCHITATPGHTSDSLRRVLALAKSRGYTLLDQDECEPVLLEDDSVRLYLKNVTRPSGAAQCP
jgi:hypothetical protein